MSSKVVLIHAHPTTSFIGRCLTLVNKEDDCIIYNGYSNHKFENNKFLKWLLKNEKLLARDLKLSFYFFKKNLFFKTIRELSKLKIGKQNKLYLRDIVIDSILKNNKIANLYYSYSYLKRFLKIIFTFYAKILICKYKIVINDLKPDLIILSHPTYVSYGTFLIAATEKNVNVNIVAGAFSYSYLISNKFQTYHITKFAKYLYKKNPIKISIPISGQASNAILNDLKLKIIRPTKIITADTLIICSHCFGDNNHVSETSKMLFENYYEWLKKTLEMINNTTIPKYKNYILKLHPFMKMYGETKIYEKMIKSFHNKKINLKVCYENQKLSDLIPSGSREITPIFVTVHGSICHELGSLGLPVVACGIAQGPLISQYNPSSISEYERIIKDNQYASLCLDNLKDSLTIRKESIAYQSFYKSLQPNGLLKDKLYQIRDYFYFNSSTKKVDYRCNKILLELKNLKPPSKIMLENGFGVFIPNNIEEN